MNLIERLEFIRKHECSTDAEKKTITEAIDAICRNIPQEPNKTEDHTWGIHKIVPVCPMCDTYLTEVYFLEEGKKVTYCDHCGQAIDWSDYDPEN